MNDTYLVHHGILGQKWGVRRYQDKNGRLTNAGRKHYSEEGKETAVKTGDVKYASRYKDKFSNKELNSTLERYTLEKRLSTSMNEVKSNGVVGRGKKKISTILKTMAGLSAAYGITKAFVKNGKDFMNVLSKSGVNVSGATDGIKKAGDTAYWLARSMIHK